jgi:CMP/dCMP kinase
MIITISGNAGSGKSTLAKMLADQLGWERFYIGGIRRQKAKELGMTLAEYNRLGESNPATDIEIDQYIGRLAATRDNIIIEGRTAWYFAPKSLKIFIEADEKVGAGRIYHDLSTGQNVRNEGNSLDSMEKVLEQMRARMLSDRIRYKKYYDIDVYDQRNYDYVLDTTDLDIETAYSKLSSFVNARLDKN